MTNEQIRRTRTQCGRPFCPPAAAALTRRGVRRWRHRPAGRTARKQRILFTGGGGGDDEDDDDDDGRPLLSRFPSRALRVLFSQSTFVVFFIIFIFFPLAFYNRRRCHRFRARIDRRPQRSSSVLVVVVARTIKTRFSRRRTVGTSK